MCLCVRACLCVCLYIGYICNFNLRYLSFLRLSELLTTLSRVKCLRLALAESREILSTPERRDKSKMETVKHSIISSGALLYIWSEGNVFQILSIYASILWFRAFMMLMLMLWPLAVTPVTHFGAYHRPADSHFFLLQGSVVCLLACLIASILTVSRKWVSWLNKATARPLVCARKTFDPNSP